MRFQDPPYLRVARNRWVTVCEMGSSVTLKDIIETAQRHGIDPEKVEVSINYEVLELGYMHEKSEAEMDRERNDRIAAIRKQNAEYERMGLL